MGSICTSNIRDIMDYQDAGAMDDTETTEDELFDSDGEVLSENSGENFLILILRQLIHR